jgi:hypothetical protein
MRRIFVPTESARDWKRLLAKPDRHWKPGFSAMTVAAAWEDSAPRLPKEIEAALDATRLQELARLELLLAIPEWQVALPGGVTASHTDVLAVARNDAGLVVLAVEAKVDEPFGPTCGEKRKKASEGQGERLEYLHEVLALAHPVADTVHYQLLHRTASAILTARDFHAANAIMVVQSFSPAGCWNGEFLTFASALACIPALNTVLPVPGHTRPRLYLLWCSGDQHYRSADFSPAV